MGAMYSTSSMQSQRRAAGRAGFRYRWTWPHVPDAPEISGPGYAVEIPIYLLLLAVFALPIVQSATGVTLSVIAVICAIHASWLIFTRAVLVRHVQTSRRAFDAMV